MKNALWGGSSASSSSGPPAAALTPQDEFLRDFSSRFGPHVPDFYRGSYTEAVKEAKQRGRMLFIYLHSPMHADMEGFVRDTLCTESVCNFLRENFVSWAGNIKHADAYRLCTTLNVTSFPYVAALSPQGAVNSVAVVFRHSGPLSGDELIRQLLLRMETHNSIVGHLEATRTSEEASREQARTLRQQQDAEYEESLLMDQTLKESEAMQAAQLEEMLRQSREMEAAAEAERARLAAEEEARRVAAEAERAALAARLPAEPAATSEGVVNVSLRLPTGAKVARRFLDSQPLEHVRLYAQSVGEMERHGDKFRVISNFPRKVHEQNDVTLASLKLGKQILFVIEPLEEEEEDRE